MANRNYPSQKMFGMHMLPVRLDAKVTIGASGAPTLASAPGIASVTRLSAGTYRFQLQDNYFSFLTLHAHFRSPVSGSNVNDGSFSVGTVYAITAVGTTNWAAAGLPAGLTPTVGQTFKAATVGGAGTGTAKVIGASGITSVEAISSAPSSMLNNQPFQSGSGGFIDIQCLGPTSSSVTTPIATDPANGSLMTIEFWLNNSSVQ